MELTVREETRSTMIFLMALQDVYTGHRKFTDEEIDETDLEASDLIKNCIATILERSRSKLSLLKPGNLPEMQFKAGLRPGRNDPSPPAGQWRLIIVERQFA